jgi:predicted RNA-binding Zn ribbon-like protein
MAEVRVAPGRLRLVQELVNTLDVETGQDELARAWGLHDWLVERGLLKDGADVAEEERRRAVDLREALRALLLANAGEPVDPAAVAALNRAAAGLPLELRFACGGTAALEPATGGVAGALAEILGVAYASMLEGTWPRLKVCRNDACRWAFYDGSKNRSAAWCSMAVCGSRQKARAYRARRARDRDDRGQVFH